MIEKEAMKGGLKGYIGTFIPEMGWLDRKREVGNQAARRS
jgi:hypothetical protein